MKLTTLGIRNKILFFKVLILKRKQDLRFELFMESDFPDYISFDQSHLWILLKCDDDIDRIFFKPGDPIRLNSVLFRSIGHVSGKRAVTLLIIKSRIYRSRCCPLLFFDKVRRYARSQTLKMVHVLTNACHTQNYIRQGEEIALAQFL